MIGGTRHRVALIANSAQVGGGNQSLLALAAGLTASATTALVVSPAPGELVTQAQLRALDCVIRPTTQPEFKRVISTLRCQAGWAHWFSTNRIDLVHANGLLAWRSVAYAAWAVGRPVVCHIRYPSTSEEIRWLARRLPTPSALIFNSHGLHQISGRELAAAFPGASQHVIHNALDLSDFLPRSAHRPGRALVGAIANFHPVKGLHDFLAMARLLQQRGVDAAYVIVGDDIHDSGYGASLRRSADAAALGSNLEFLGHRRDVAEILRRLDVLVVSSHMETFGRSALEAMACSVPVVATRVGGLPEVVDDGVTGVLVPAHAPAALADAVQTLAADADLRNRMGAAGRVKASRSFGIDDHVTQVQNIYARLGIGGPGGQKLD